MLQDFQIIDTDLQKSSKHVVEIWFTFLQWGVMVLYMASFSLVRRLRRARYF